VEKAMGITQEVMEVMGIKEEVMAIKEQSVLVTLVRHPVLMGLA